MLPAMPAPCDPAIERERSQNLWASFERKFPPIAKSSAIDAAPSVGVEQIGGLAAAKDEVLTTGSPSRSAPVARCSIRSTGMPS